ncbi:FYN-binding protein 1 isoform X1 [Monodelphis domestica]|uniref:FYN-binding protein 1 isoform X1 n=1 Tax=Monodelphis domestica TaxID=13616 RepID=UPI0024E21BFE|nr:FYN-binding protein 1 isoform X1 [Monodelphis domestica]XP_007487484.2 FYN-binding protein 1 isoform X1 [Monodelphis domestica]XP_007487488.2 FYN-binding protein 1 isoform X1 [Monodelphis domestica]
MDGKADVKSLMAKFNTGGNLTEEVSVGNRPFKVGGHSSPSGIQARKSVFTNQGNASPPPGPNNSSKFGTPRPLLGVKSSFEEKTDKDPKPPYLKPTGAGQRFGTPASSASREPEGKVGFLKPVGPKPFDQPKEDAKPVFPRPSGNKPLLHAVNQENDVKTPSPKSVFNAPAQENEPKPVFPKLAAAKGKFTSPQDHDSKPPFTKPAIGQKPSANTDTSHEDQSPSKSTFPQKGPAFAPPSKPKISTPKPGKEDTENKDHATDLPNMPFPGVTLKPAASRGTPGSSLNLPKNTEEKKEERKIDAAKNVFMSKMNQDDSGSGAPPPKFSKPPSKLVVGGPWNQSQEKEKGEKNSTAPKQKPLPALFTLGPAPQKPNRPPTVDLARFRKASPANSPSKGTAPYSGATSPPPPPPPPAHPTTQPVAPVPPVPYPTQPPVPSLPPRNIKIPPDPKSLTNEENYDDVDMQSNDLGNPDEDQESDGETYEDIEATKEREKKKDKEEKKRLEQEKKEQKEKEKKEQEIKKKFKLTGPIQVLHQAKACCDVKGGKNELSVKQGEEIEIIRITDNPEGKWLGRTSRGTYGYIKTTAVEIDYDSLKRKKNSMSTLPSKLMEDDQELYDDVAEHGSVSSHSQSGSGGVFPNQGDEIYDGIEDDDDNGSTLQVDDEKSNPWTWGILKMLKGKDDKKKSIRKKSKDTESDSNEDVAFPSPPKQLGLDVGDEVYDDVDSSDFPAPPIEISAGVNFGKGRLEEKDLKKLKKQEKEEKEFKKKFKFDGEIRVLYTTQVVPTLTSKKWGTRDLQLKPGESLEVIQSTDDTKVLCRNEEGKYGYVLRSCLVDNEGEIYDDIADGCIYDND